MTNETAHRPQSGRLLGGIRARLSIALAVAVVVPTVLVGGLSVQGIRNQAQEEATEGSLALVRVVGFGLDTVLQDARRALELTARTGDIINPRWDDPAQRQPLGATLAAVVNRYPLFAELYLLDTEGEPVLASGGREPDRAIAEFEPELADNYGGYVSDVYRPEGGSPHIFMVVEIRDTNLEKRGFLAAEIDLSRLHAQLENTLADENEQRGWRLLVVDSRGRAIYPESAWGNDGLRDRHPAVDKVLGTLSEGHVNYDDEHGVNWFATYKSMVGYNPFRGVRWGLVVERPTEEVLAGANATVRTTVLVALGFLILAVLASTLIARRLTRPLRGLARAAHDIGTTGVEDADPPSKELQTRGDEIGELARAQATMLADLKNNRAELQRRHDALRKAERLSGVGLLAAGVAHEVNNPMTTILGYGEFLLEDKGHDHPDRSALELIVSESTRVREIVRGLLEMSRKQGDLDRIDLAPIVRRAATLSMAGLPMEDVELEIDVPEDGTAVIDGDAQTLLQLLTNLITNAVHALENTASPRIVITVTIEDTTVMLSVADNGPGIDPVVADSLFEPFVTTKTAGQGTGLGLAVVSSIVEDHGATIEVLTMDGGGTRFVVSFGAA